MGRSMGGEMLRFCCCPLLVSSHARLLLLVISSRFGLSPFDCSHINGHSTRKVQDGLRRAVVVNSGVGAHIHIHVDRA